MPYYAYAIHISVENGEYDDSGIHRVLITAKNKQTLDEWYETVCELTDGITREEDCDDWFIYDRHEFDIQNSTNRWRETEKFLGRVVFTHLGNFPAGAYRDEVRELRRERLKVDDEDGEMRPWATFSN
ncbi:hypothetical protein BDV18DRAFT_162487 [Aspergillus unguis]